MRGGGDGLGGAQWAAHPVITRSFPCPPSSPPVFPWSSRMRPARPLALQSYPFLWEDRYLELAAYLTTSPSLFSLTSLGSVPVSNGHPCRGHCPLSHTHPLYLFLPLLLFKTFSTFLPSATTIYFKLILHFPCPALEQAFLQGALVSLIGEWHIETKSSY